MIKKVAKVKKLLKKGTRIAQRDGIFIFIKKFILFLKYKFTYNASGLYSYYLARLPYLELPRYNNVPVVVPHLPWENNDKPFYEYGLVSEIEKNVERSDEVVIVGGGYGVTAVKAAKIVGNKGSVIVYEGSSKQTKRAKETVRRSGCCEIVDINRKVVGPNINVYGSNHNLNTMPVKDIPECDVLELDCEGAEVDILRNLTTKPKRIFVESHGLYNSPTDAVISTLEDQFYEIKSITVADRERREYCFENDIMVVSAKLKTDHGDANY